jgi:hypothetical protein
MANAPPRSKDPAKNMTTRKQRVAAKRNIKKAAKAARRKRTVAHLPKRTRTALGKEGAKAARKKRH